MAKTKAKTLQLPDVGGGRRKWIGLLVVGVIVWLVIRDPAGAAAFVNTVWHALSTFVRALG